MAGVIRSYRASDRRFLEEGAAALQNAAVAVDPWKRLNLAKAFTRTHATQILRNVRKDHGFILIASERGRPVGFSAGWVQRVSLHQRQEEKPNRTGYLSDLVVLPGWRGRGIGSRLIAASERRFRLLGCDTVRIGVFYPNVDARRLYRARGFQPRILFLAKRISKPPSTWGEALRGAPKNSAPVGAPKTSRR
jgi:ribosomal protein S18 acetylase RimI-like enzyme